MTSHEMPASLASALPQVSVVIPTHNRSALLALALQALTRQTLPAEQFEVIVISDGATDDTEAVVARYGRRLANLSLLRQAQRGPAAARNAGISAARAPLVSFTDDDCLPDREWLRMIVECFRAHPRALGVEGKTTTDPARVTPLSHQVVNLRGGRSRPTCNVSYRREALLAVGGFDEDFAFNGEDEDMSLAVAALGDILFDPSAIVSHPPRPLGLRGHLRRIARLEPQAMRCEFRLAQKHPAAYRRLRGGGPWRSIFYLTARLRLCELWEERAWLRRNPSLWLAAALLLCVKLLYRLALVPVTCLWAWSAFPPSARAGWVYPARETPECVPGSADRSLSPGVGGGF
jgi:glycosyltransferase involved in cell wall biosynthesis